MPVNKHRVFLLEIIESGIANLQKYEDKINQLNVFPVPDGDTGSNMLATMISAWNNIKEESISDVDIFSDIARGALLGARGNSGVITSQIFKGLSEGVKEVGSISNDNKSMRIIFRNIREYSYNAVSEPVEGTILSVVKALDESYDREAINVKDAWTEVNKIVEAAVENTPNQLPILKESGVVDSGAYGIMVLIQGVIRALANKPMNIKLELTQEHQPLKVQKISKADPNKNIGYCTEFILTLRTPEEFDKKEFKKYLSENGDSIVMIVEDDLLKVHVHSKKPGVIFNEAQKYGEFTKIKADNMATQATNSGHEVVGDSFSVTKKGNIDELAIIAVSDGKGIDEYFQELGVDVIVSGGQSMNPSTQDFIDAVESLGNKNILILPNNSNIILTANAVKGQVEDKNIFVLPTKSLQQGIVSLMNISKEMVEFNDYSDDIIEELKSISEAVVTYAVRDTNMNGVEVKKNDFISIMNKKIVSSTTNLIETTKGAITKMVEADAGLITILYNKYVNSDQREALVEWISETYEDVELEVKYGGQNVYSFIIFGEM